MKLSLQVGGVVQLGAYKDSVGGCTITIEDDTVGRRPASPKDLESYIIRIAKNACYDGMEVVDSKKESGSLYPYIDEIKRMDENTWQVSVVYPYLD